MFSKYSRTFEDSPMDPLWSKVICFYAHKNLAWGFHEDSNLQIYHNIMNFCPAVEWSTKKRGVRLRYGKRTCYNRFIVFTYRGNYNSAMILCDFRIPINQPVLMTWMSHTFCFVFFSWLQSRWSDANRRDLWSCNEKRRASFSERKMGPKMEYPHLEDHPMTCKWLITMVIVSPLTGVVGPLPNGLNGL